MQFIKYTLGFLSLFAVACGAPIDADDAAELDNEVELGELGQSLGAKTTDTTQFGTQFGGSRCNKTSSGQTCNFLRTKQVKVCVESSVQNGKGLGFDAAALTQVSAGVARVDTATNSYVFSYQADTGFGCIESGVNASHVYVRNNAVGGSLTNSTADYGRATHSDLVGLIEDAGVVGNYQSAGRCVANVDISDARAKGLSTAEDEKLIANAAAYAVAGCLGEGGQSVFSTGQRITRNNINVSTFNDLFSAAEQCQLTSAQFTSDGHFTDMGDCSGD